MLIFFANTKNRFCKSVNRKTGCIKQQTRGAGQEDYGHYHMKETNINLSLMQHFQAFLVF